jgi:hypothetical protein
VTPAWRHIDRRLEEKFNSFELHHVLRRDNEAADTLTWLGSSYEPPPPVVFTHDLFKPSIRLEEDILALMLETLSGENSPVPVPGIPSGKGGMAPTSEADRGTSARPIGQDR